MRYCQQAAEVYEKMLVTEYNIVIKGIHGFQLFTLYFTKDEFKHSSGIHKSTTTDEYNKKYSSYAANVIFEKALNGEVDIETIASSDANGIYNGNQSEMVKRIYEFPYLEDYFDKADTLYIWKKNIVGSIVDADYLIELPSNVYPGENIHLFLGTSNVPATSKQTIQDRNRVNLSNLKFYKEYGLRVYTEFSNSKNYASKLTPLKILYKEKVEYKCVNGCRIEQSFTRQICDENFEEQMQKKGGFFPLQSSNIMQVTFNSPNTERIVSNNGAAALASPLSPRPPFGQAVQKFLKDIVNKVKEMVKRLFRKSNQDTAGTDGTNRDSGNSLRDSAPKQADTTSPKSETHELRDKEAPAMDQSQKPLVKTAVAPRKTFSQGLDELANRPKAKGSPKLPSHDIADRKHHK